MRHIQNGSWSHYAPYVSIKFKLAEAEAQLSTLRGLGEAIRQQRQILQQSMENVAEVSAVAVAR
jgi:hypothetical protein